MHAREHGVRRLHRPVELFTAERRLEDPRHVLSGRRVHAVAREQDEAVGEPPERVAAKEQPHPLALAERQDPHRDGVQLRRPGLEQRVAGIRFEDLDERLCVVAVERKSRGQQHALDLALEQRDLLCALAVRGARVQAEETPLAGDIALRVEPLDADVVEVRIAVDRRARVRLGEHERRGLAGLVGGVGAEGRARPARLTAEDPPAGLGTRDEVGGRLRTGAGRVVQPQVVLAVAEEGEVVVREPAQERARRGQLFILPASSPPRRARPARR